jgi:hypothetical protein
VVTAYILVQTEVGKAAQESRAKLTCATHWNAQPAMIGWPAEWREG